jgi:phosphoenolpyruvate-protein phosphotransferase/dihydroxyacetone kinase phosphotransfer subunit
VVGIVVVSHSRRLAESAVELALQMVRGAPPPIEIAAGLDDHVLGTDAARVKEAIDRVASPDGVLVVMDLGSAVLSAELALELRGDDAGDCRVVLSDAPLVEGLVAAVTLAAAGASLAEVAADAGQAGHIKTALLNLESPEPGSAPQDAEPRTAVGVIELAIHNEHGLHARPAARFVETVRRFDADVTVTNLTQAGPAVSGRSVSALSTLGALAGHRIHVAASGRQAREALAAVAALVRRNFDESVARGAPTVGVELRSGPVGASPGIGFGPKTSLTPAALDDGADSAPASPDAERERLLGAIEESRAELTATCAHVTSAAGRAEAEIFAAHVLLLDDEELVGQAMSTIDHETITAQQAWRRAVAGLAAKFEELADPYQRARADDVRGVGDHVLGHLVGGTTSVDTEATGVLVAYDLLPAQVAALDPARVVGIVTASGTPVSHSAILARSLGIPAVVGAGDAVLDVPDGTVILVDGSDGVVVIDPEPDVCARYRERAADQRVRAEDLLARSARPAITTDGTRIDVVANIASVDDAVQAVRHGGDGVGLLRTEFLFLDRAEPPGEDEQLQIYTSIADALEGRRLTIRTLDVGGDKPVPYLRSSSEANPFLGCRGLRLSLRHPELFKAQLRALVRLGVQHPVTVLFPMVTTVDELRAARALLAEVASEVGYPSGQLPPAFEVGAMAEVPAFALRARAAVPLVDVISVGSNDLTQYTAAAERGNPSVGALADGLDPAVLRLVADITQAAASVTRVAVCGELAAEPGAAALLIGLGVRELSMNPRSIPEIKSFVRSMSIPRAQHLAGLALQRDSAASVRALLGDLP